MIECSLFVHDDPLFAYPTGQSQTEQIYLGMGTIQHHSLWCLDEHLADDSLDRGTGFHARLLSQEQEVSGGGGGGRVGCRTPHSGS